MKKYFEIYVRLSDDNNVVYVSDGYIAITEDIMEGYATTDYIKVRYNKDNKELTLKIRIIYYLESIIQELEFIGKIDFFEIPGEYTIKSIDDEKINLEITFIQKVVETSKINAIEENIQQLKNIF